MLNFLDFAYYKSHFVVFLLLFTLDNMFFCVKQILLHRRDRKRYLSVSPLFTIKLLNTRDHIDDQFSSQIEPNDPTLLEEYIHE